MHRKGSRQRLAFLAENNRENYMLLLKRLFYIHS